MTLDFCIAGAPKCGTSALAAYLAAHPAVCFSRPKEPHYFYRSATVPCDAESPEAYFEQFFPHFDPARHRLCGEGTPRILASSEAMERLLTEHPEVKLLVLLRDPAELVLSWHGEMLRGLEEDRLDPAEAWRLQEGRAHGEAVPDTCRDPRNLQYASVCALGSQVEALLAREHPGRALLLRQCDLLDRPGETLRGVCGFLGLPYREPDRDARVNVGSRQRSAAVFGLYQRAFRLKHRLFGTRPLPAWVSGVALKLAFRSGPDRRLDPAFRAELEAWAEPEREKLRAQGLDLSSTWTTHPE